MIDRKLIIEDKKFVKQELAKKGFDVEYIDALHKILLEIRAQTSKINELNRLRNELGHDTSVSVEQKRNLRKEITNNQKDLKALEKYCMDILLIVPNLPDPEAPVGNGVDDNIILFSSENHYRCKTPTPLPHWEIAEALGIFDSDVASRISGPGFCLFKGKGAKLLRALISYAITINEEKYTEIISPHLVTSETLTHTGHLPKFADEQYKCEMDNLWLIPTAEVPLTAAVSENTFDCLPVRYMGYSLSFRRESGASGRDTRGLQRVHEFHKLELFKVTPPESAGKELMELLSDCIRPIKDLGLEYRVVELCTGEMGDKYARCFDIEVYSPGVGKWLEVSSVGHFSDYQARRANIKCIDEMGKKRYAYTMNGSGLATPRVWLSIVETYQQPDGSIKVPDVLVPFVGCEVI